MNLLVIDVGTSSMRGLLFNQGGELLYKKQREYRVDTSGGLAVEQDPGVLRESLMGILACVGE